MQLQKKQNSLSLLLHALLLGIAVWHLYLTVATYLSNHLYAHDAGIIDYFIYNTWHGAFFHDILVNDCFFERQFVPSLLLLIPFQMLSTHFLTIPLLETITLFSGAWAVAWLTSGILNRNRACIAPFPPLALAVGVLYAANVLTGSIALSYHYESFTVGFSLWALAAFANKKYKLFWMFLLITLGFKSDICLSWGIFGVWWVAFGWERHRISWKDRLPAGIKVFLFSLFWFFLVLGMIAAFRHLYGSTGMPYSDRYNHMGDTLGEKIVTVTTHPLITLTLLGGIAWIILPSVLFLPLLVPSTLFMLLPGACIMGLADHDLMCHLFYYYSYSLVPFLFLGTALALVRIVRFLRRFPQRRLLRGILTGCILLLSVYQFVQPTRVEGKRRLPEVYTARHAWMRETIRMVVPPNASVAAQNDLLCQIPYRVNMLPLSEKNIHKVEYWVCDNKGFFGDVNGAAFSRIMLEGNKLVQEGKAEILVNTNGLVIVRRKLP